MIDHLGVIAEPKRRRILQLVWDCERSASDIARHFTVTFGAVSQHLHALREAGLVDQRKQGRHRFYRARKEALGPLASALEAMWTESLLRLKVLAETEERTQATELN